MEKREEKEETRKGEVEVMEESKRKRGDEDAERLKKRQ